MTIVKRKEIFILPGNTDLNRGDQALVWETIRLMEDVIPNAEYVLFQSGISQNEIERQSSQTRARGYAMVPKLLKHPGRVTSQKSQGVRYSAREYFLWGIRGVSDLFISSSLLSRIGIFNKFGSFFLGDEEKKVFDRFKNCYAVVVKGGGFVHTYGKITDFYTLYFILFHVLLAIRFKRRVLIMPNSFGPIKGRINKKLVRYMLSRCDLVTVRENVSGEFLKRELNIESTCYPDLGFFFESQDLDAKKYLMDRKVPLNEKRVIGFTMRPYRFPESAKPDEDFKHYLKEFSDFIAYLVNKNCHVVLFAHTLGPSAHEDDRIALKQMSALLHPGVKLHVTYEENSELDCQQLMALYAELDLMVGTRFHSVIFALNVNVPCIAVGYGGNKSFGIMNDMDLSDFVFPIERVTSDLLKIAYEDIMKNKNAYLQKIKSYRDYLSRARRNLVSQCIDALNN